MTLEANPSQKSFLESTSSYKSRMNMSQIAQKKSVIKKFPEQQRSFEKQSKIGDSVNIQERANSVEINDESNSI